MRKIIGVVFGGFAIAGLLTLAPTPAGAGGTSVIEVTKTVEGPGSTGPYAIEVSCSVATSVTPMSFELNDGESQDVVIVDGLTCTVEETGTQGAAVSYVCTPVNETTCDDDQTVRFTTGSGMAEVDITNTFTEAEPASAEPVEAAPTFTG